MTIVEVELEKCNKWIVELINALLSTILRKANSLGVLRLLRPIKILLDKRDRNKFCDFHRDHGHTTDECLTLKGQIAMLLKNDQLLEFLEKDRQRRREETRPSSSGGGEKVRVINKIVSDTDYAAERGWGKIWKKSLLYKGSRFEERKSSRSPLEKKT